MKRTNDQYFSPGDKVMRVAGNECCKDGRAFPKGDRKSPPMGEILCVEDFWEGPQFNVVMFVGYGGWASHGLFDKIGWPAVAFRKVEEIKLCADAASRKHIGKFVKTPAGKEQP